MLDMIATLFEIILFNPFDIMNEGITIAITARRILYPQILAPIFNAGKFPSTGNE
jgi:hypothetical protein